MIANESLQSIRLFQWGLVPFWTKDESATERIRIQTINAKAETIHEKPSFRSSIMTKRCLVLADGFYEWREEGNRKYPYYISLVNNEACALAGIWDRWLNSRTGEVKETFSIITTRANRLLERIHNTRRRMPVILRPEDEAKWLEKDLDAAAVDGFLEPYDASQMQAHPVSRLISTKGADTNVPEVMKEFRYEGLEP